MEIFLIQGSLRQRCLKLVSETVPLSRGCTDPFTCLALDCFTSHIIKMKPDFIYAHTHIHILFYCWAIWDLTADFVQFIPYQHMSPKSKDFFFITTVQLSHSRKLTSMSYYFLIYSPHSNFSNYTSNISYSCFLSNQSRIQLRIMRCI